MKQFNEDILCYYCLGCNKEELDDFEGVRNCKGFIAGMDTTEFYKKLKEGKKNGMQA